VAIHEKAFLARSVDGGLCFTFVSWLVPWDDPHRAVMPAPVRLGPSELVAALRRKSTEHNWLDCYVSSDNGAHWVYRSKIAQTEDHNQFNGNPPALIRLQDGRLCCAFGNRSTRQIRAIFSKDEGASWGAEVVLREDFRSANGWPDLGYVRLFECSDGRCVAIYFWCSAERPQTHIAATIFKP
jgi:hypothetical protein